MSDLFTEREHYIWMLNVCLDLSQSHHHEDLLLHQYVIIAAAKTMAISRPEVLFKNDIWNFTHQISTFYFDKLIIMY